MRPAGKIWLTETAKFNITAICGESIYLTTDITSFPRGVQRGTNTEDRSRRGGDENRNKKSARAESSGAGVFKMVELRRIELRTS
jgi:hypothetical protein